MRLILSSLIALLMALAAPPGHAESILDRRYTSAKLDGFWQETLGASAPQADWFQILVPGSDAVEPVTEVPALPDFGVPFPGTVIGESATPAGETETSAFPVIPLSREDAAVLIRRLAWSEIYLNRYRFFEPVSTDTSDVLETLNGRQFAAGLEAALITARLYFAAPDLTEKCRRLTRLRELDASALAGLSADATPAAWRDLVPGYEAATERVGNSALAALVCSVEPVRGRAETIRLVETRVRERIMEEVRRKVEDTLTLLEAASTDFQTLVNDMDVTINSAEILELERVFGNAASNMVLVMEDQLKAGETLAELSAVDLSQLNQPGQLREFETGQAHMAAMVVVIDDVMAAMADLSSITDDPEIAVELAPCEALRNAYSALDLSLDSGTLSRRIEDPYNDCISRVRAVVARFQEPTLNQAMTAELSRHVRQISEAYLSTVMP